MAEAKTKENAAEQGFSRSEAGESKKGVGILKLILIVGAMQLFLAAGAFALIKFVVVPKTAAAVHSSESAARADSESELPREIHLVENIIVNPAGTNGTRYLSTSIGLEMEKSEKTIEHMKEKTPVVRDILIAVLSSRSLEELGTSEGKESIRKDILEKVNEALAPESISKVYFVDYVLQ